MLLIIIYAIVLLFSGGVLLSIYTILKYNSLPSLNAYNYLLSVSLSYSSVIIILLFSRIYGETAEDFISVYLVFLSILVCFLLYLSLKIIPLKACFCLRENNFLEYIIPCGSLIVVLLYLLKVGPYLEIPSDAWWHIGEIQRMYQIIQSNGIPAGSLKEVIGDQLGYWYYIAAMMIHLSGIDYLDGITYISYINNLFFSASFYSFSFIIVDNLGFSRIKKHIIAMIALMFMLLHFGISEFAFIRYYAYAPVMLNFILFLTTVILFFKYMGRKSWLNRYLFVSIFFIISMRLVHLQEILLLLVVILGLMVYQFVLLKSNLLLNKNSENNTVSLFDLDRNKVIYGFYITVVGYILVHSLAVAYLLPSDPFELPDVIPYEKILPFMKGWGMVLLDPEYKFYEVVTSWGILVYFLFILKIRSFIVNPYLMVGMLIPFFTVFNPVFTNLFFRISYPEVLYRLCYIIPLGIVGACLLVIHISELFDKSRVLIKRIYNSIAIVTLIIFLLPVSQHFLASPSRFVTLKSISPKNDYRQWMSLINYLNNLPEKKHIYTDKVTGYVLKGMTQHYYDGYKFTGEGSLSLNVKTFSDTGTLKKISGGLLIVNLQDGAWSVSGLKSGHWPADILYVSQYYSKNFLDYISHNRENFKNIWHQGKITVYQIYYK